MRFAPTGLHGVVLVELDKQEDERGYFARSFCAEEFGRAGLPTVFVQCNTSFNRRRGTLRGLHYQDEPRAEGKLVRCTRGALFDVAVDIRRASTNFCCWTGATLTAENGHALWIPPGFAHGFVSLADETEVFYQMTEFYEPSLARGLRWNDPAFAIDWPVADPLLSEADAKRPLLK